MRPSDARPHNPRMNLELSAARVEFADTAALGMCAALSARPCSRVLPQKLAAAGHGCLTIIWNESRKRTAAYAGSHCQRELSAEPSLREGQESRERLTSEALSWNGQERRIGRDIFAVQWLRPGGSQS